jgi:hypothetical protein
MSCPRCRAADEQLRVEHRGVEDGALVWTVRYCTRCAFTWRDTEPARSIDYEAREAFFRVDPDQPEKYRYNIPPAER